MDCKFVRIVLALRSAPASPDDMSVISKNLFPEATSVSRVLSLSHSIANTMGAFCANWDQARTPSHAATNTIAVCKNLILIFSFLKPNFIFFLKIIKLGKKNSRMTTPHPSKKARFYIVIDTMREDYFEMANEPITFSLPSGTPFPPDLSEIMRKTGRYLRISTLQGRARPSCSGDGCECLSCNPYNVCNGYECLDENSLFNNVDYIECNKSTCMRTNEKEYIMFPLYPSEKSYLPEYKPKFRFMRVVPSQTIKQSRVKQIINSLEEEEEEKIKIEFPPEWKLPEGITMPPGDFIPYIGDPPEGTPPPGWKVLPGMIIPEGNTFPPSPFARNQPEDTGDIQTPEFIMFSITYPSMMDFDTSDKFLMLYETIVRHNYGFLLLNQDKYYQHNVAVLQQILKANKLPKTLMNPQMLFDHEVSSPDRSFERQNQNTMEQGPPFPPDMMMMEVVEKYDEIILQNLVVPVWNAEDTDPVTENLLTPEPNVYLDNIETKVLSDAIQSVVSNTEVSSTRPPRPPHRPLSILAKFGIGFAVIVAVILLASVLVWKMKKKKRPT